MTTARLHELQTILDVARACGLDVARIEAYAEVSDQTALYSLMRIPKRGYKRVGTYRIVYEAKSKVLSAFHRSIAMIVVNSENFGEHVQGFVKKRSTRTNARRHLGAQFLLHADIKEFFDSISTDHVYKAFIATGISPEVARKLAHICTIDGYLRQGTRCAPAIANLVCQHLDFDMLALARSFDGIYTRYADDLTFSSSNNIASASVEQILNKYGFELRDGRCYIQRRGRSQYVTGLTVTDRIQPRLPRHLKRRLRLIFYYIEKFGVEGHLNNIHSEDGYRELSALEGMLSYVNSIEPQLAHKWQISLDIGRGNSVF